jgi:exosortase
MFARFNTDKSIFSVSLLALGLTVLFCPMFIKLFSYGWKNASYDHGIFILPISLYLIFQKKGSLQVDAILKTAGVINLLSALVVYFYSFYNDFLFLQVFSFIWLLSSLFYLNLTKSSFNQILFPLAYLAFMIPPPGLLIDSVTVPLKGISMFGGYLILKLLHIPVQIEGLILNVSGNRLFITDACSGYRSMVTLLALGAVYTYTQKMKTTKKWIAFLMVIPLGIMGNVIRIAVTGVISLKFGVKYAEGFFHESSSTIVFAFTVLGLMLFCKLLKVKEVL